MIDTGASKNYIAESLVRKLDLPLKAESKAVEMANGKIEMTKGLIQEKIKVCTKPRNRI